MNVVFSILLDLTISNSHWTSLYAMNDEYLQNRVVLSDNCTQKNRLESCQTYFNGFALLLNTCSIAQATKGIPCCYLYLFHS